MLLSAVWKVTLNVGVLNSEVWTVWTDSGDDEAWSRANPVIRSVSSKHEAT